MKLDLTKWKPCENECYELSLPVTIRLSSGVVKVMEYNPALREQVLTSKISDVKDDIEAAILASVVFE